ncbi:MAG: ABC transporter ATP-binding protein [Thaumarchaeota archaeon]|nr:ABC transporter ATP-binding protein [Nitrososphaerota archaeon]MDG6906485.1 ABC transporter ATP-binding protein [Nitrososphaerota archaeon]
MHTLELKDVNSGYEGSQVLHKISFRIDQPSIYVVLGPNGAGKTTLFRTISGILQPYSGSVELDGESLITSKGARRRINYLSHYNAIPEEMTVENALRFYADIEGGKAEEVLGLLSLENLKNKKISDLSQGQKKRVSIAKVFLCERDLYLLDEPTANLDPAVSKEIRDILLKLSKDKIVLYSSHNLYEARDVGTFLILLKSGTVSFYDRISNVKSKEYRVGIRANEDITKFVDAKLSEAGYYVMSLSTPEEAGEVLRDLVSKGVLVTEMRQLDNPLQELFDGQSGEA